MIPGSCLQAAKWQPHVTISLCLVAGCSLEAVLFPCNDTCLNTSSAFPTPGPGYPSALPAMRVACGAPRSLPCLVVGAALNGDVIPAGAIATTFARCSLVQRTAAVLGARRPGQGVRVSSDAWVPLVVHRRRAADGVGKENWKCVRAWRRWQAKGRATTGGFSSGHLVTQCFSVGPIGCADANYKRFITACPGLCWSVDLQGAGHLQFLDMQVSSVRPGPTRTLPCSSGPSRRRSVLGTPALGEHRAASACARCTVLSTTSRLGAVLRCNPQRTSDTTTQYGNPILPRNAPSGPLPLQVGLFAMFSKSGPTPDEAVRRVSKAALVAWALELAVPLARGQTVDGAQVGCALGQYVDCPWGP